MPHLSRDGDVWLLNLGGGENRLSPSWVGEVSGLIGEVAGADGARALVTCADGKFWSTGLDLDWLFAHPDAAEDFLRDVHELLARVLVLPVPTVAAVQGHAFAAGAMLARCHDQVVMRADRGYWCLPEVDLGLPFSAGMNALLRARLPVRAAHEAMTTGRRYGGTDAVAAGIADVATGAGQVVATATGVAAPLTAKAGPALGAIKELLYGDVVTALRTGPFLPPGG